MSTAPSTSIKCLMIGQAGIGKSTFLRKFPNSKLIETGDESCEKSSFNKPPATTTTIRHGPDATPRAANQVNCGVKRSVRRMTVRVIG